MSASDTTPLLSHEKIIQGQIIPSPSWCAKARLQVHGSNEKILAVAIKVLKTGTSDKDVSDLNWWQRFRVWFQIGHRWTTATVQDQDGQFYKVLVNINSAIKRLNLKNRKEAINVLQNGSLNLYSTPTRRILAQERLSLEKINEIENKIKKPTNNPQAAQSIIQAIAISDNGQLIRFRDKYALMKDQDKDAVINLSTGQSQTLFEFVSEDLDEKARTVLQALEHNESFELETQLQLAVDVDAAQIPNNPNAFIPIATFSQENNFGWIAYKNNELHLLDVTNGSQLNITNLTTNHVELNKYDLIRIQDPSNLPKQIIQNNPFTTVNRNTISGLRSNYGYIQQKTSTYQVSDPVLVAQNSNGDDLTLQEFLIGLRDLFIGLQNLERQSQTADLTTLETNNPVTLQSSILIQKENQEHPMCFRASIPLNQNGSAFYRQEAANIYKLGDLLLQKVLKSQDQSNPLISENFKDHMKFRAEQASLFYQPMLGSSSKPKHQHNTPSAWSQQKEKPLLEEFISETRRFNHYKTGEQMPNNFESYIDFNYFINTLDKLITAFGE